MAVRRMFVVFAALASGLLVTTGAASAATYNVSTVAQLRSAMSTVNATPGASDTIELARGAYDLGGTELPAITNGSVRLSMLGAGARSTTISGQGTSRILLLDSGSVSASGITFTQGFALNSLGGAIGVNGGSLALTDVAVTDSVEEGTHGGGGIGSTGNLTLDRVTISANKTDGDGGGLWLSSGSGSLTDTTLTGNVVDTTLPNTPNYYSEYGGGLEVDNAATLQMTNTTVFANSLNPAGRVGTGGGIYGLGSVSSSNSIVAENAGGDCTSPITSTGPNMDSDSSCFTGASDRHGNPLLQPLGDNGGQTDTDALSAGSPAIDHGQSAGCPAVDQRGVKRPQGAACDLGAYEATAPFVATGAATQLSKRSASLKGLINPDDQSTTAYFQWGTSTAYGHSTAAQAVGSGFGAHALSATISGLKPGTSYHYRVVAVSQLGTSYGADRTLTTFACTVAVKSGKVHLGKKRGTVAVTLRCNEAASGKLSAALKVGKHKTLRVHSEHVSLRAGRKKVVTVKLPGKALKALAAGSKESIVFTLKATYATITISTISPRKRLRGV